MADTRPALTSTLTTHDFRAFYWLKEELIHFCRQHTLDAQGSKGDLADRIAHFLETGERQPTAAKPQRGKMPLTFTRDSVIEPGWRCSEGLRAFFEAEIGTHFHFNQVMRDFIKHEHGKTLQQAIHAWQSAYDAPVKTEIAPQFEYNQHTRDYYDKHPNATRAEVIAAWKEIRSKRRPS